MNFNSLAGRKRRRGNEQREETDKVKWDRRMEYMFHIFAKVFIQ